MGERIICNNGIDKMQAEIEVTRREGGWNIDVQLVDFGSKDPIELLFAGDAFRSVLGGGDGFRFVTDKVFESRQGKELLSAMTERWLLYFHDLLKSSIITPSFCLERLKLIESQFPSITITPAGYEDSFSKALFEMFVAASLGEARRHILNEINSQVTTNLEYKSALQNYLGVENSILFMITTSTLDQLGFRDGNFFRIWAMSWRYSMEQSSRYVSNPAEERKSARSELEVGVLWDWKNLLGGDRFDNFRAALSVPGGGKSTLRKYLGAAYEGVPIFMLEQGDLIEGLDILRQWAYDWIQELKLREQSLGEYHAIEMAGLPRTLLRLYRTYMFPRLEAAGISLLKYRLEFLEKLPLPSREKAMGISDMTGLSPLMTLCAIDYVNEMVERDEGFEQALMVDPFVTLPEYDAIVLQFTILHSPFFAETIQNCVLPKVIIIDVPIDYIIKRNALDPREDKREKRQRHEKDLPALRALNLAAQQLFPASCILVRGCVPIPGGYRALTPFQLACEAERLCAFSEIGEIFTLPVYSADLLIQALDKLQQLMPKVEKMYTYDVRRGNVNP